MEGKKQNDPFKTEINLQWKVEGMNQTAGSQTLNFCPVESETNFTFQCRKNVLFGTLPWLLIGRKVIFNTDRQNHTFISIGK